MALTPKQAFQQTGGGRDIIGWKLDRTQRRELLARFPPTYSDEVADHVTLATRVPHNAELPGDVEAEIVGRADDGNGVEAMVVRLDGTTDRPDGSTYHITWSLDKERGRKAKESNDVIARLGWTPIEPPVAIELRPARWP
jgi:hypothetical protein